MRIALLVSQFPAVSETFIMHHITGLLDRRHEVDIYAYQPARQPAAHEALAAYRIQERTVYWGFEPAAARTVRLARMLGAGPARLRELARVPGALRTALRLLIRRGAVSPTLLYGMPAFRRNGRRPYDIIHCHYGWNGAAAVLLREMGVLTGKVVTTFHGTDISAFVRRRGRHVYGQLFRLGDLFLPVSERWRARLLELGCDERRIVVHRLGIDTARLREIQRLPGSGRAHLLTVARLVEKKGLAYALQAVASVAPAWPSLRYTIVGDGPLRGSLERLASTLGIGDRVRFLGARTHEEVISSLADADIFILPSVTAQDGDQEGIPIALMEAMAAGLPVLATEHSGIPELVADGVSGYLVPERNAARLAERLAALLADPERRAAMGQAGTGFVCAQHDVQATNDRLVAVYEALLGREVPGR
jgi:colanic acid/amylovoran biosynthesis glycosyltransferase